MGMVASWAGEPITSKTRFRSSRRGPSVSRLEDAVHAKALGEVLHAWNRTHAALFMVFGRIATDNDWELALRLWHTASGDKAQRAMLEAAAAVRLKARRSYFTALRWALGVIDEIGGYRNDIVHSEMTYHYTNLMPGMTVKESSASRLTRRRLDENWRAVKGDLHALANYLETIQLSILLEMPRPLARRPKLRFATSTSGKIQEKRRLAKKAARQKQREKSRI